MKKEEGAWNGEPLGPYHVTLRHRGIGGGVGRLYEARNDENGNPALVLMPGPKGELRPKHDWQVRATSSVSPPYLSLEVEKSPGDGQLQELTWMLARWSTALETIDERPAAQAHLTGGAKEPRKHPRGHFRWLGGGLTAAALLALAVLLWPRPIAPPPIEDSLEETLNLINKSEVSGGPIMGIPMPDKPVKDQQKPPCDATRAEKEIRGGCWLELAEKPPCSKGMAEYQGRCYVAVRAAPPVPTSINP
ncbi:protein kinase [Archangium lansingense]|uniref:Protein kinase n=1 Tax=Archangium lansingense TaxID=2995310 RepID=A0ABT4AM24_9BACT|nr:protein kinase [Archangium lansinium]MCY1082733.1 protein kinase [Archangium lansinium]